MIRKLSARLSMHHHVVLSLVVQAQLLPYKTLPQTRLQLVVSRAFGGVCDVQWE